MNWLDPRSVIVISSILAMVTLLMLISLRRNVPRTIRGIGEWIAAYVAFIVAVALLVLRGIVHPVFGVVLANTLIISAILLFGHGIRRFYGEQVHLKPLVLASAVVFASLLVITFVVQNYPIRLAFVTGSLFCAYALALRHMQRKASGTFAERVTQLSFVVPAVGIALRLLTVGDVGPESQLFQRSPIQSLYLASLGAGALSAGVGFILMVNERTRTELENLAHSLERTTQELRQRNEVKSKFLAYAGHDIRQPLQAIHYQLASLMDAGLDPKQEKTARMMEASVNALTDLLDSLLDISKLDAGAIKPYLKPVDLDIVLVQLVQEFIPQAGAKGLRLKLRLPPDDVTVLTDERLLSSVLRNLLGNAIKYTQQGGVLVAVRRIPPGFKLQVWDTGIGIPEEHLEKVFEEYYQIDNPQRDRSKGLGLGLAIVHRISALLDLNLACRSRPGKGTVMEIMLPMVTRPPASIEVPDQQGDSLGLVGVSVVVVEDAAEVAQALVQWLQAHGARVSHYASAEEALAVPGIQAADIYLSDYRLSGRMSGIDFLNTIRARSPDEVHAVLLTGDTSSQFIEMVASSGWPILYKPVNPRELLAVLKLLRASARQPGFL